MEPATCRGPGSSGHFSSSPRDATVPMLEYEQEEFPQSLLQGPKMSINLRPPSSEHWNIDSDLILPLTIDTYQWQREAKWVEQDPERESVGAEVSPKEAPATEKAPQVVVVAAGLRPQQRPHTREKEIWRLRSALSNAFMPSASRYYTRWEA